MSIMCLRYLSTSLSLPLSPLPSSVCVSLVVIVRGNTCYDCKNKCTWLLSIVLLRYCCRALLADYKLLINVTASQARIKVIF